MVLFSLNKSNKFLKKPKSKIWCRTSNVSQLWSQAPPLPQIKKSELSSFFSCWRDVNQFRVQERLMGVSDLTSSATRLSCLPQRRLSALQEHCSIRIDVCISTAPKKSSPRLDKSCKKTGFGLRLSEGNFPFIMGECFACQHGGMLGAFGHRAFEGIKDGLLFYLLETALFKETANRLTF